MGEIGQPGRVMEDPVGAVVVGIRSTDDADHGEVLAASTGDGVQDAEATHRERDDARAHAFGTSVAVGSVASVELVTAADDVELRLGDEVVEKGQIEVAGDGEDVPNADLHQPMSKVAAKSAVGGGAGMSR